MFKQFSNLFSPIDDGNSNALTVRETFKALNDDAKTSPDEITDDDIDDSDKGDKDDTTRTRTPTPAKKEKEIEIVETDDDTDEEDKEESDKDSDEEVDELKLLEEDLEEPDEEKLELVTPVSRKHILKKYPKLFEDFPYLEKAYYREQQFTEIFPNPDDARLASEKSEVLDKFEQDLGSGNLETIFSAVKSETPKSFNKMIDNLMPTLQKVDNQAYTHLVGNTIKQTIVAMVTESNRSNNEILKNAAHILNQFVFASSDFEPPKRLSPVEEQKPENSEEEKFRKERQDFIRQRFDDTRGELNSRVNNSLKATIETNIDPNNTMTDYVRRNAVRDALETVENLISKDNRFRMIVDKLWEKSVKENFSRNTVEEIRRAYLSKAKTLLDTVIKKSRNDALRGMGKRVKDENPADDKNDKKSPRRGQADNDRSQSRSSSDKSTNKGKVPAGMSSLQFLMQDDD